MQDSIWSRKCWQTLNFFDLEMSGLYALCSKLDSKLSLSNREAVFLDCHVSKFKSKTNSEKHVNCIKERVYFPSIIIKSSAQLEIMSTLLTPVEWWKRQKSACIYLQKGLKGSSHWLNDVQSHFLWLNVPKPLLFFLLMNFVLRVRNETKLNLVIEWCLSVNFWRFPLSSCKKHWWWMWLLTFNHQ